MFIQALRAEALCRQQEHASTGFPQLDAALGGGFPKGQLTELSGAASSGKSTLAFAACSSALAGGQVAAWIDPAGTFWPLPALETTGRLERLLVLRPTTPMGALKGVQLLLDAPGAAALVVVDLPSARPPNPLQLVRLQRLAERAKTAVVFLNERARQAASLGPAIALRLFAARRFTERTGWTLALEVLRNKVGPSQLQLQEPVNGPNRLRLHSTL